MIRQKAQPATIYAFFRRVRNRQEEAFTTETIIAEVTYVLSSRGTYRLSHADISGRLKPVLRLRGLKLPHKRICLRALDLYAQHPRLDIEDALAVAHMERAGLHEIVSYDADFERLPGIRRTDP